MNYLLANYAMHMHHDSKQFLIACKFQFLANNLGLNNRELVPQKIAICQINELTFLD